MSPEMRKRLKDKQRRRAKLDKERERFNDKWGGRTLSDVDPKCHWLEHYRPAIFKGWTGLADGNTVKGPRQEHGAWDRNGAPLPKKDEVRKVYKSYIPDAAVLQKSTVKTIVHGAPIKWRTHNSENIWDYEGLGLDDLNMMMPNRIKLMEGSFSKFQSDALLKNVNLKAHNHLANLTDSPGWLARNDG